MKPEEMLAAMWREIERTHKVWEAAMVAVCNAELAVFFDTGTEAQVETARQKQEQARKDNIHTCDAAEKYAAEHGLRFL